MPESLHDSLTDTHTHTRAPKPSWPSLQDETVPGRPNLQNVRLVEARADGAAARMSLDESNWLNSPNAPTPHSQSSLQQRNQDDLSGMDIAHPSAGRADTTRSEDESLAGASAEASRRQGRHQDETAKTSVGHGISEQEETRRSDSSSHGSNTRGKELADYTQLPQPGAHGSTLSDGPSLASREAEVFSGHAMPHEGGPSITESEAVAALEQAEQGVEPGSDFSDDGYETDTASATSQSLATSAREFIYEHGRRYHSYKADVNPYLFPNDDREQDREDLKHAMFLKLFNKALHFAPVPTDANVLDLGTGTGIWCVDFADLYPSSTVLGIDLSPIQTVWVPPNLKFMVDDAEAEWLHPRNSFDLIHTRHTIQAFRNWPQIYERAFEHLKPGAWMESQELDHVPQCSDGTMKDDNPMLAYWLNVSAGLKQLGVDFRLAPKLADMMRAAGFVNVTERVFFTPIGPWPKNRALKEVGLYWRATIMEGVEAIALGPMIRGLGWRKEEVEVFIAGVRKAYLETTKEVHAWMPFYVVYGQKPRDA